MLSMATAVEFKTQNALNSILLRREIMNVQWNITKWIYYGQKVLQKSGHHSLCRVSYLWNLNWIQTTWTLQDSTIKIKSSQQKIAYNPWIQYTQCQYFSVFSLITIESVWLLLHHLRLRRIPLFQGWWLSVCTSQK